MRRYFSSYLENIADSHEDLVFITGDLGYKALEGVRQKFGNRFINAGVAEQNMISMAAGMASRGFQVICYSIAPFVVYRCLEQIRNDVCFHKMPVYITGNGGGYGYGIMGSSHHAIEDIGTLSGLPGMNCYVPAFNDDLHTCMDEMFASKKPSYLRLGLGKKMADSLIPKIYGSSGFKSEKPGLTIITQGPIVSNVLEALNLNKFRERVELFVINKMPIHVLPDDIKASIISSRNVITVEEHIELGGLGANIATLASKDGIQIDSFKLLSAKGYPGGTYGSQAYHQLLSGLDSQNISKEINSIFTSND